MLQLNIHGGIVAMKSTERTACSTMPLTGNALVNYSGIYPTKGIVNWWQKIPSLLYNFLLGGGDIRISESYDQDGDLVWDVYDPFTRRNQRFYTEQDVRIWLESRYSK
ncbi:hypothetical protein HFV01_25050 [Limnospira fusiformis SAG 85.79]|nr:hypothetical protein SPLC1_S100570 [Arthrospira platensis C1]QJB28469.1 hypothetical protein HFV01_25050 [Limnospira fusiformis SAG 85.79]QNH58211.1 MAG: hypothetical protein H2674_02125 [Limnospira indica BM01]RAQ45185.1 hypothetical protein B9S53_07860 [Arthrospira sp. O9.13F]